MQTNEHIIYFDSSMQKKVAQIDDIPKLKKDFFFDNRCVDHLDKSYVQFCIELDSIKRKLE